MSLAEIYQNFCWRIESITPASAISPANFRRNDHPLYMTDEQSPEDRIFVLYWDNGDEVEDFSDLNQRWSTVYFTLEVAYDATRDLDKLHTLMTSDRNQIIATLRDGSNFVGYDSGNTTTDVNLKGRWFDGDEFDRDRETMWILRQTWKCKIAETE